MSENASGAGNQQETKPRLEIGGVGSSETIRRAPLVKERDIVAYLNGAAHDATRNKQKRIRFAQKYPEWLETIQQLLAELGQRSWIYREGKERNVFVLETLYPKIKFDFDPRALSAGEKIAYIRGFFDAEGGVPRNGKRFYVQFAQKDRRKVKMLKQLLEELGIECGEIHNPSREVDPHYWRVFVLTGSHAKFAEVIGSYHPVKAVILHERMKI